MTTVNVYAEMIFSSQLDKIKEIALRLCNQEDQKNQTVLSLKETDKAVDIIQKEVEKLLQMKEQIEKEKM